MTCEKPGCYSNCHVGCLMPMCEKGTDLRRCEVFSDVRPRKVRWSVGDAQRFLNKLEDYEFGVSRSSAEGERKESTERHKYLRVKPNEIITLESGHTLYGKPDKRLSGGSTEHWVWSKNYYTNTIFLDPQSYQKLAEKSNSSATSNYLGMQLKPFTPFEMEVRDCSHMEAGNKMTCQKCGCPLDLHAYNDYENVQEFVFTLGESERKSKEKELERLRKGERVQEDAFKKTQQVQEKAVREKQRAVQEMSEKLEAFNQLSTSKNFEAFLLKQISALDLQFELVERDTKTPDDYKEIQKANILDYKQVFVQTKEALEEVKRTGQVAKPQDVLDFERMQKNMDDKLPNDNVEVVELIDGE